MTWDFFMLVVVAYSIFYTLLAVSFSPTQTDEIVLINWIVTICFGIDLFLSKCNSKSVKERLLFILAFKFMDHMFNILLF